METQRFFIFTPKIGEDSHFDEHIFQRGWNHQLENFHLFLGQDFRNHHPARLVGLDLLLDRYHLIRELREGWSLKSVCLQRMCLLPFKKTFFPDRKTFLERVWGKGMMFKLLTLICHFGVQFIEPWFNQFSFGWLWQTDFLSTNKNPSAADFFVGLPCKLVCGVEPFFGRSGCTGRQGEVCVGKYFELKHFLSFSKLRLISPT